MNLRVVLELILCSTSGWGIVYFWILRTKKDVKVWQLVNLVLLLVAVYGVSDYSILHRTPSSIHQFTFFVTYNGEFWREMLMNVFLYLPLGLSLPHVLRRYAPAVFIAFLLSLSVETWQYFAGTGLAQGTDVLCNTLGAAVGGLSFLVPGHCSRG